MNHARGRGGVYPYFVCIGRQQNRQSCNQRALRIELVEEAVAEHYATVRLSKQELDAVSDFLLDEITSLRESAENERSLQERRKQRLEGERTSLLDAHLAEAVPLDLLKTKQDTITAALMAVDRRLNEISADFVRCEANLTRALARAGDCEAAYREANDRVRRQFNQAFFEQLIINEDYGVVAVLAQPFDKLLGGAEVDPIGASRNEERPQAVLVGADSPTTPGEVVGWSQVSMVELEGLEPSTSAMPWRRSPS